MHSRHAGWACSRRNRFTGFTKREFEHRDRTAHLEVGNSLCLESFARNFNLVSSQPDIAQTENAFDVRTSSIMLSARRILQIKQHTRNSAALRIANHSLYRSRARRSAFWNTSAGLSLTRE